MNIIDKKHALDNFERDILERCAKSHYRLGDFSCIDEVLDTLGLDVVIEDGEPDNSLPPYLEEAHEHWECECSRLKTECPDSDVYKCALRNLELVCNEIKAWPNEQRAPGVYDHENKTIKLYPKAIHSYGCIFFINIEVLMGTLVREALHAYFMRPGHEDCPYNYFIEEPLAEFGVLLYIWHVSGTGRCYDLTKGIIGRKKTIHRLAVNLMEQHLKCGRMLSHVAKYLYEYRFDTGKFTMPGYDPENHAVILPYMHGEDVPFIIDGRPVRWTKVVNRIPRYFWDERSKTLGLDGEWVYKKLVDVPEVKLCVDMPAEMKENVNVYIGEDFNVICDEDEENVWVGRLKELACMGKAEVSPMNRNIMEQGKQKEFGRAAR